MTTIIEKVEWNMADELNKELSRLRKEVNMSFMSKDYSKTFEALTAMKMTSSHVFSDEEHKYMDELSEKIQPLVNKFYKSSSFNKKDMIEAMKVSYPLKKYLLELNKYLMTNLDKYGFLGGRKKDSSRMMFGAGYDYKEDGND